MNDAIQTALPSPAAGPLFAARERRILLWVVVAAISWRWLGAIRSPLPSVDACRDLWLAGRLAAGDVHAFVEGIAQPVWALLLAPAIVLHAPPFLAAQVLACVLGGMVVWPVAVAAERLRQGAGVPAAILALCAAGCSVLAGAGSAAAWLAFGSAWSALCLASGRWGLALLWGGLAVAGGVDSLGGASFGGASLGASLGAPLGGRSPANLAPWQFAAEIRLGWGIAGALAILSALPPRPRYLPALWLLAAGVIASWLAFGAGARVLAVWSPVVIVLAGVGLARLPVRLRDLALCGAVLLEFYTAWHAVEPRAAVAERALGRYLQRHLAPAQQLVSDVPRVLYFAGQPPSAVHDADALLQRASAGGVACVVLGPASARQPTLTAALASRFARFDLPPDLADLVADRQLAVFMRR